MRREFLMLGKAYDPSKHKIAGFYMSEKLDGIRAFWDGGITRGVPTASVPWASVLNPKTGQPKTKIKEFSTGLWSRYGNPIMAPDWFLNTLPSCPLDGELWAGHGGFQTVTSVCKKDVPGDEWRGVQYGIFGTPSIWCVFQDGEIKNSNFLKTINRHEIELWLKNRDRNLVEGFISLSGEPNFAAELANLKEWIDSTSETHFMIRQEKLSDNEATAKIRVEDAKRQVIEGGGEGLVLRNPQKVWVPKRSDAVLKVKGELDAEGTIVGFTSGRETDKGSKLLGKIGALILDFAGKRLELAGLTDEEREFSCEEEVNYAKDNPGIDMPKGFQGRKFKVGEWVTFQYRELTNEGIPKEARYWRKR